jgi:hypothetical protein
MGVYVYFETCFEYFSRDTDFVKQVAHILAGPYVHTEMLVVTPKESSMFTIHFGGDYFCKTSFDPTRSEKFTSLKLLTSPEEDIKFLRTCEACVASKITYNRQDMLPHGMPFRDPENDPLSSSCTLLCSEHGVDS